MVFSKVLSHSFFVSIYRTYLEFNYRILYPLRVFYFVDVGSDR
jgi:hypothetical protein